MTFNNTFAPNAQPGQYIQVDPAGRVIRITDNAPTSWAATTYIVNRNGSLSLVG